MVDVLPAPFGPRIVVTSPARAVSESSSTATTSPERPTSCSTSTAGTIGHGSQGACRLPCPPMLDVRRLRNDLEATKAAMARRHDPELLTQLDEAAVLHAPERDFV